MSAPDTTTPENAITRTVREVGAGAIELYLGALALWSVFVRTLYWTFAGKRDPGAVVQQCYEVGNKSAIFIGVTMGFFGMILVFQSGLQALRVVPDLTMLGATFIEILVRDLAASIGALMLATRVGAGIAAEVGSMVVTEQVDALRMSGVDPVNYLIVPRYIACIVMTPVLVMFGGFVSLIAGMATAYFVFDVNPSTFLNPLLLDWGDFAVGITKCFAYGAAIPIVSGYCGLSTHGGSEGVGWATTRAVVNASLATIVLNFFISGAGFVLFPG
ncbi:MAG: ABC transporter permease [Deltaproteobacteria bacterium]|nr:ABC transporter permease [Deltaproteobacteria bacterium]